MPRPPRFEYPSALYHVTARGNERRALFRDDRDREKYLSRIAFYRERFRFQLLSYCLMTNHVHLAIRTGSSPLSRVMAGLHSSYAEWFNRRHDRCGHLFQGRYKAFLVQEDNYVHALIRYIHRNPVRARIVGRACDYPWSSDRALRQGRGPDWLDVDSLLSLLDDSRRAAVRRYVEIVDGPEAVQPYEELTAAGGVVIGDEAFRVERFQAIGEPEPPPAALDLDTILQIVARDAGIPVAMMTGARRGRVAAAARCLAAYLARRVCRIPVRRVARHLGRDDSAFARPLVRLELRLATDPDLRTRIDRLITRLRNHSRARQTPPLPSAHPNKSKSQD
jgi:REP element-mobilizing transposase RayT